MSLSDRRYMWLVPAWLLVSAGAILSGFSLLVPWRSWYDENQVVHDDYAWNGFTVIGHVLVAAALVLLAFGLFGSTERRVYWWLAVGVAGLGLAVYWLSTPIFEASQTDTVAWNGPGVATATAGIVAILAGAAVPILSTPRPAPAPRTPRSTPARVSLVFGIIAVGLALPCFALGAPLGATAVVLGVRARRPAADGPAAGDGMAWAGIICGLVAVGISVARGLIGLS